MPTYVFPSRQERQNLINELKAQGANGGQLYTAYLQAVKQMDDAMEQYSAEERNGVPAPLDAAASEELQRLIVQAAEAGEKFLASAEASGNPAAINLGKTVNRLQGVMNQDFSALQEYDPAAGPKSLPEIQNSARTRTIDLRGRQITAAHNMQNARLPMTIVGADGKPRHGVFTKATHVNVMNDYNESFAKAKALCKDPEAAAELDKIVSLYRQFLITNGAEDIAGRKVNKNATDAFVVGYLASMNRMTPDRLKAVLKRAGVKVDRIPSAALKELAGGLKKTGARIDTNINGLNLALEQGDRLDNRNSAMSATAQLLGVPTLIARADNMKFIDENGKVVEGTFMDYAKGIDPYKNPKQWAHVNDSPLENEATRGKVLKQFADLQVLDYLCLNVDRHPGNVFYQVNEQGDIIGIQGIDNDSSFGRRMVRDAEVEKLRVISKSMADRVKNLSPEMLKFTLRGKGLSEEEILASARRLQTLKKELKSPKCRLQIVSDKDFVKNMSLSAMKSSLDDGNLVKGFEQFLDANTGANRSYRFQPLTEQPAAPDLAHVASAGRRATVGTVADSFDEVSRLVEDKQTKFRQSDLVGIRGQSENFRNLTQAVRETAAFKEHLFGSGKADETRLLTDINSRSILEQTTKKFSSLKETALTYLYGKMGERGAESLETLRGKNAYEQRHIDYAKQVVATVDEYEKKLGGGSTEAEREDRMMASEQREMDDRRAALEAVKKIQQEQAGKQQGPVVGG